MLAAFHVTGRANSDTMEKQEFSQLVKNLDPRFNIPGRKYFFILVRQSVKQLFYTFTLNFMGKHHLGYFYAYI